MDNKPPVFVSGSATPSSIATGDQITFQSMWDDPEKKSIVDVQVRFRKQGTTEWQIKDLTDKGNYTFSASYVISGEAGTYEYQFRASDADTPSGDRTNTTNWLSGGTFEVQDGSQPFGAPNLISPTNGAAGVSSESVTFKWGTVTDATNYRIVISKDSSVGGFDDSTRTCDPDICQTTATSDTSYTYQTPADITSDVFKLEPETTYYWHVRANSSTLGIASDWSAIYSFTTEKEHVFLTVVKSGSGIVTSTPVGIDCGTVCSSSYLKDTVVTLTAVAAEDYTFLGWGGACSGKEQCQVTMNEAKNVTAMFGDKNTRSLKIWLDKDGSSSYDAGEELKNTTVAYRIIKEGSNPVDTPLSKADTDENGVIYLSVQDGDTIYIEKEYEKEKVIDSRSINHFLKKQDNPYYAGYTDIDDGPVANTRYEFVMASDIMKDNGASTELGRYSNFPGAGKTFKDYEDSEGTVLVRLGHPKWQWNLTICFEDPHTEHYYQEVKNGLKNYANELYNYTDGYSLVKNIIFIKGLHEKDSYVWRSCDIKVLSEAVYRANAIIDGYKKTYGRIFMQRWYRDNWPRTLAHESGHYLFGLLDEYKSCAGQESGEWTYREKHDGDIIKENGKVVIGGDGNPMREPNEFPKSYGIMGKHHISHELSDSSDYFPVDNGDIEYNNKVTEQYCQHDHESNWVTFQKSFKEITHNHDILIDKFVIPTNIGRTYPLPEDIESNKRLGPKKF